IGAKAKGRLDGRVGHGQPRRSVIGPKEVEQVVSVRKLVMGKGKGWIKLKCLIQQANGLEQALVLRRAEQRSLDERFGPRVKIVGCKILCRALRNRGFLFRR